MYITEYIYRISGEKKNLATGMKMMATINVTNQAIHIQFQIVKDFVFFLGGGRGVTENTISVGDKKNGEYCSYTESSI